MSAFMCSDRHLTALAAYAVRHGLSGSMTLADQCRPSHVSREALAEVFGVLARENVASLDARYPNDKGVPIGEPDMGVARMEAFLPITIIKACHCYAYQSCEHTGWETSRAKQIVERIEAHAVRSLPGYEAAPWGL
jgi:hypothetical protein